MMNPFVPVATAAPGGHTPGVAAARWGRTGVFAQALKQLP